MRISAPRLVTTLAVVGMAAGLAAMPAAHADTSPRPNLSGDAIVAAPKTPARTAQAQLSAPAVSASNLRPIHYTVARLEFPDAHAGGDLATDAQVTAMVKGAEAFWARTPGLPHPTFDIIHAVISIEGPALVDVDQEMRAAVENVTGRTVDGLIGFYRSGYLPGTHYTCHAEMPGAILACFGAFPLDQNPPGWRSLAHEIGHNFGLCGYPLIHDRQAPSRWTPDGFTGPTSYGNPWSIMGGGFGSPSVPCQAALGILTPSPLPLRVPTTVFDTEDPHSARAWSVDSGGVHWTLEYRARRDANDGPGGVALYRDGQLVETDFNRYSMIPGRVYHLGGHRTLKVVVAWTWRGHRVATVYLGRG